MADLIAVGVPVFRRLVREHPALYRIAFQRIVPGLDAGPELTATRQKAWNQLIAKVKRLELAGLLGDKPASEATVEFIAMLDGLANAELRGDVLRTLPTGNEGTCLAERPRDARARVRVLNAKGRQSRPFDVSGSGKKP